MLQSHPIYTNLIFQALLSIQHYHLVFLALTFRPLLHKQNVPILLLPLPPTRYTKPSHLHTRGQAISTLSSSPHPHCTSFITNHIYIEKPREHDTL